MCSGISHQLCDRQRMVVLNLIAYSHGSDTLAPRAPGCLPSRDKGGPQSPFQAAVV